MLNLNFNLKTNKPNVIKPVRLDIYDGFQTKQELINYVDKKLEVDLEQLVIIYFLGKYYGVLFESFEKEIMIGEEQIWWRNHNKMYYSNNVANFKKPYSIGSLRTRAFHNNQIALDLKEFDSHIAIYRIKNDRWVDISSYKYSDTYLSLLGLTFYHCSFSYEELNLLSYYFDYFNYQRFFKNDSVVSINPFKGVIYYRDGKQKKMKFIVENPYYRQ